RNAFSASQRSAGAIERGSRLGRDLFLFYGRGSQRTRQRAGHHLELGSFVGCTSLGRRQCSRGAVCVKALPQGSATTPRRTLSGLDIRPLQRRLSGSDYPGMAARDEAGVTAVALQYSGEWSRLVLFVCVW